MRDDHLTVGTFTPSLLIDLARSSGELRRARLEVHESLVPSSPAQFTSLEVGEFDAVFTSPDNVIAYHFLSANPLQRRIPLRIICGIDRGLGLSLCATAGITDAEDLRGKALGVDVAQSGFAFVAYALLDRAGLRPGDYTIEALGSTPRRTEALIEGRCAVTILNAGNELRAVGAGCSIVSPVTDLGPYFGTVLATRAGDGAPLKEVNLRFADALLETTRAIVAGDRESDVIEASVRLLHLTELEAQDHHECLRTPTTGFVASGRIDRASIATIVELRRSFSPTPELDTIIDAIDTVVLDRAIE